MKILKKKFFEKDTKEVAISLLGKILIREIKNVQMIGKIVEVEAYYGKEDPASRAYLGFPKYVVESLYGDVGKSLIYMVHSNWLLNIVAHEKNHAGAILIRAIEPIRNIFSLTNGPGKLTKALKIDKFLNGIEVYKKGPLYIAENNVKEEFKVESSKRIGVKRDLNENLRFYIKNNKFVSRNSFKKQY